VRGEHKVPGGKLVAVDVDAAYGRTGHRVGVRRFFLEPDEALEDIDAALVGMSTSAGVNQLAQAITGAPPDGAARHRIDVVRRISGGGAMFMEPGNRITYSVTVPASLVEGLSFQRSTRSWDE